MRLLWEQMGFAKAEVAFVRHSQPFLRSAFWIGAPPTPLPWIVLFQNQWESEHAQYARVMIENAQRSHGASLRFAQAPRCTSPSDRMVRTADYPIVEGQADSRSRPDPFSEAPPPFWSVAAKVRRWIYLPARQAAICWQTR